MKKPRTLSPVERAILAAQWRQNVASAQIHSMIGDDSHAMVDKAGKVMFVILGAALIEKMQDDHPEIRIIRGAVNALHDQAGEPVIDPLRRASIKSGLEACARLLEVLPYPSVCKSACDLHHKLRNGDIAIAEFQELIGRM